MDYDQKKTYWMDFAIGITKYTYPIRCRNGWIRDLQKAHYEKDDIGNRLHFLMSV